jgi:hypothetical protein
MKRVSQIKMRHLSFSVFVQYKIQESNPQDRLEKVVDFSQYILRIANFTTLYFFNYSHFEGLTVILLSSL